MDSLLSLGDVYVGRKLMSRICLFILWSLSIMLTINLTICYYVSKESVTFNVILPVIILVAIGIFEGIFEINLLTYGAGQLCNAPSEEVSSFIYLWYWSKNAGAVLGIFTDSAFKKVPEIVAGRGGFPPLAGAAVLTATLLLHRYCQDSFETERFRRIQCLHWAQNNLRTSFLPYTACYVVTFIP